MKNYFISAILSLGLLNGSSLASIPSAEWLFVDKAPYNNNIPPNELDIDKNYKSDNQYKYVWVRRIFDWTQNNIKYGYTYEVVNCNNYTVNHRITLLANTSNQVFSELHSNQFVNIYPHTQGDEIYNLVCN